MTTSESLYHLPLCPPPSPPHTHTHTHTGLGGLLILSIDLVTEQGPAISLAYEPAEAQVMERPPRDITRDRLISGPMLRYSYLIIGVMQVRRRHGCSAWSWYVWCGSGGGEGGGHSCELCDGWCRACRYCVQALCTVDLSRAARWLCISSLHAACKASSLLCNVLLNHALFALGARCCLCCCCSIAVCCRPSSA
jgi:hypothetical protein